MKILYLNDIGGDGGAEKILSIVTGILYKANYDIEVIFGTNGDNAKRIKNIGVKTKVLDDFISNKIYKYKILRYTVKLYLLFRLIKISNADIVITNTLFMQLFASPVVKCLGKRLIWHEHNIQPEGFRRKFIRLYASIFPDGIIVVSHAVKNVYKDLSIYSDTTVLHNGIVPLKVTTKEERHILRKSLNLNDNQKIILSISRITDYKGLDVLIKAFLQLDDKDATLLILGDASSRKDRDHKKTLLKLAKSNKNIIFLGWQEEVYKYINITNFFVAPARGADPFPTTILECMSLGVVCLVSDIGGQPEAVQNKELFFSPNDVDSLKNRLKILNNKSENQIDKYSVFLKNRFIENFSIKHYKNKILFYFDSKL
jgi:glycosyltransferase involved in cell wall biosynthesis